MNFGAERKPERKEDSGIALPAFAGVCFG